MKKILAIFITIPYLASSLFAGTMFVQPGDRATSMGGAFTAVADDATAIYYNPAGLTQLENSGVEFTSCYLDSKAKSTKSLQNNTTKTGKDEFPLPSLNPYGYNEPASYNKKDLTVNAFLPFVAGYTNVNDINIAVGVYALGGGTGKWNDTVAVGIDTLNASIDSQYGFLVGNISGAKKISDQVSIGLGFDVIYMQSYAEVKKTYTSGTGSPYPNYDLYLKRDGDGYGFEVMGGVMYTPIEKMRLGLTLRSGATIKIDGTAKYTQTGATDQNTSYTQNYAYPFTCGLGVAYDATERLLIAASVDIADYSTMKEDIDYQTNSVVFVDSNKNSDWKTTTMVSLGARYKLNEKFNLMAGIRRDPSPYPQDQANLLNTDQYNLTTLTIGTEYKINSFNIGLSFAQNISDKTKRDGAEYEFPSNSFRFGIKYKF